MVEVVLGMVYIEEFMFNWLGGDVVVVEVVYVGVEVLFVVDDVVDVIVYVLELFGYVNFDFIIMCFVV